jgi:hypothetical protein
MSELEKTQWFTSDLSSSLELGEIVSMHIVEVNGRQVLRIDSRKLEEGEYKTVRSRKSKPPNRKEPEKKKGILSNAITSVFGEDKSKPYWMD